MLFIIVSLLILMAITNPSKSDYGDWVKAKAFSSSDILNEVGKYVDLVSMEHNDYVFFSVYKTRGKIVAIGVFKNFIAFGDN